MELVQRLLREMQEKGSIDDIGTFIQPGVAEEELEKAVEDEKPVTELVPDAGKESEEANAVSYTHLTLPTKRIV